MSDGPYDEFFEALGGREAAQEALGELAADETGREAREGMARTYAEALGEAGQLLWVEGFVIGSDRKEGQSPFGFGDDDRVGLATICQIAGELARGTIDLLDSDNRYGAQALTRQLVEVQYLAAAFAQEDEIAAEWLRANGDERRRFWTPAKLRGRAEGFLPQDYWEHCDRGGHPTPKGLDLLPAHEQLPIAYIWIDLVAHLEGIWGSLGEALSRREEELPREIQQAMDRVADSAGAWYAADELALVVRALHTKRREALEGS